jgi:hypothetical protein
MKLNPASSLLLALLTATSAWAQVPLNQAGALAGNVTPGDTPGFPITISQPGHYMLTSNLSVPLGAGGIHITAPNVVLDLNGYTLEGPVTCTQNANTLVVSCSQPADFTYTAVGIRAEFDAQPVVVRNGNVRGFASYGVYLPLPFYTMSELTVTSNASHGAVLGGTSGQSGRVSRSTFTLNGSFGAYIKGGHVEHSVFSGNNSYGMSIVRTAVVHSTVGYNGTRGIQGDSNNPGAGVYGKPSTVLGTTLIGNKLGATTGFLFSLGGNFDGAVVF